MSYSAGLPNTLRGAHALKEHWSRKKRVIVRSEEVPVLKGFGCAGDCLSWLAAARHVDASAVRRSNPMVRMGHCR